MSRQQLMNMYQRQIALGGMSSGGHMGMEGMEGGLFSAQSRAGLAGYRAWHAEYKMMHPDAGRDELKEAWRMHKMALGEAPPKGGARMSKGLRHCAGDYEMTARGRRCAKFVKGPKGSALVGGYSDMTPMKGLALLGGARARKGVAHCMPDDMKMYPSGVRRCSKYMAGPMSAMHSGSALVGGFPGQKDLFKAWSAKNSCSQSAVLAARAAARAAYDASLAEGKNFRQGVAAAEMALGLPAGSVKLSKLRAPRMRKPAARAAAPAGRDVAAVMAALEASRAAQAARPAPEMLSDEQLAEVLAEQGFGEGARRRRR